MKTNHQQQQQQQQQRWLPETRRTPSAPGEAITTAPSSITSISSHREERQRGRGRGRGRPSPSALIDYRTECLNANDFQRVAKEILPQPLYEYLASGTGDEQTLQENQQAFQRWFLRPRVMRPIGQISTRTTLFGQSVSMPVFFSPAGVHALCDPENGECATARAAARAGILFGLSQHSTRSIRDVAQAAPAGGGLLYYQAYILKDRPRTITLIRQAIEAGYQGIFVTVDSVRFGYREADARNHFNALPPPHRLVNYDEDDDDDDDDNNDDDSTKLDETYNSQQEKAWDQNSEQMFEQNMTWEDIAWIKREAALPSNIPLVVKGIMTGEDAELAIAAGADGIMVSNHGGRQLDGALATIDVLPEVVKAVGGRVPVWLDSGVRRGTDVLKALALGASAVGIGKPFFFALAVGGEDAVLYLLELLHTELEAAMAICGVETIEDIASSRKLVTRHPSSSYHTTTSTSSASSSPTFQIGSSGTGRTTTRSRL